MKHTKLIAITVAAGLAFAGPARAEAPKYFFAQISGPKTCADVLDHMAKSPEAAALDYYWAFGMMSGMNAVGAVKGGKGAMVGHGEKFMVLSKWLALYCKDNPNDRFSNAVVQLWSFLFNEKP